jgi:hypothetical protein
LVHNKTNGNIVFPVNHQKTIVSKAFWFVTKSMTILSFLWITKKYVSKAFRFATKPTTVLSFMWITKKKCFKSLLVCNKTNDGIVFLVDHKKCFKNLPVLNKINDGIVFPTDHKKMFQKPFDSQQNQGRYYLFYGSLENGLR